MIYKAIIWLYEADVCLKNAASYKTGPSILSVVFKQLIFSMI